MRLSLALCIATTLLLPGCSKDPQPTTTPADPAAGGLTPDGTPPADEGDGSADGTDAGDEGEGGDEGGGDGGVDPVDAPVSSGPITDEYGAVAIAENPRAEVTEASTWANVKLEIRTPSGKVFKDGGKAFPFDQLTRIDFDFEGITHTFLLDVSPPGKSKAALKLTYLAGGEEVVRNYGFDAKLKKREVLRLDDGTALALTIGKKKIQPLPQEEREKLEGSDGNRDPLKGATEK